MPPTTTTSTTVATTTTTAPATTTTAAPTTTTTTLPPPPDPTVWIGTDYTGDAPPGLFSYGGECIGVVNICDYILEIMTTRDLVGELPPLAGPIDFVALVVERNAGVVRHPRCSDYPRPRAPIW